MKTVFINEAPVEIEKLKLLKYAEVLSVLEKTPQILGGVEGKSNDAIFNALPKLIAQALPEVIKLLAIATPLTEAEIENLGLAEVTDLLAAVFEVNEIGRVAENFRKMFKGSPSNNGSSSSSTSSPASTVGAGKTSSTSIPAKP